MDDMGYLRSAIEQSRVSVANGNFPAGAVLVSVSRGELSRGISDTYPGYQHAECRAIDDAFNRCGVLQDSVLYASMEPCLMCFTRAYWAGVRKIVFAISKQTVDPNYYEGDTQLSAINTELNDRIELLHVPELDPEAISIVHAWEEKLHVSAV